MYPFRHGIDRLLRINNGRKVDFAICGAQRAGTSGLYYYLNQHPEICMGRTQDGSDEPKFFDIDNLFLFLNTQTYRVSYSKYHSTYFKPKPSERLIGTNGAIYMYWQDSMRRIYHYNPKIKLVAILRNPVDRAYSHWNLERNRKNETLPFLDAIQNERERAKEALPYQHRVYSYLDRGFYVEQIRRIWRFFPKEQLLIIKTDDLRNDLLTTVNKVLTFLNIELFETMEQKIVNPEPYQESIRKNEREYLLKIYEYEIKNLERILNWDCSDWLSLD